MAGKSKGLGKGLGSLLGDMANLEKQHEGASESVEEQLVKIRLVEPNRNQPRKEFDEAELQELADSILRYGVIQPLLVREKDGHYEIIAGERRWRAAKLAGLKEIPVIVRDYTEQEAAEISLIENIQRKDLNPIEEAQAYQKLIEDYGMTQEALSEALSKSRTVITNSLRLLKLPEPVLEMVARGDLSTGHAKVLLGLDNADDLKKAADQVLEKSLSVRETETLVRSFSEKKPRKEKKELKNRTAYTKVENSLKEKLGTKVTIRRRTDNAGRIEIEFYSLEDIERILEHIR